MVVGWRVHLGCCVGSPGKNESRVYVECMLGVGWVVGWMSWVDVVGCCFCGWMLGVVWTYL